MSPDTTFEMHGDDGGDFPDEDAPLPIGLVDAPVPYGFTASDFEPRREDASP